MELWHARHIGLTDDDLDYLTDSQLTDLLELDTWFHSPHEDKAVKPHEIVHKMTPEDVDRQMG